MEKEIEYLVKWYKERRLAFGAENYFDRSTRAKRHLLPYSDWDKSEILEKEVEFNIRTLAEIKERIRNSENKISEKSIPIIILSLKNRAEYISNQSDIYPAFVAFVGFLYAFFGTYLNIPLRVLLGLGILATIMHFLDTRFKTRRELSYCKELINILETYEKRHLSKPA